MKEDLIFHLVTKEDWKNHINNSEYTPQSIDEQGFIHCSSGKNIEDTANRLFKGKENVMLLVINTALVDHAIKYEADPETGEEFPHIYGPLNTGAVIDKIEIVPEEDGSYNISFESIS